VSSPRDVIAVAVMTGSSLALLSKCSGSSCLTHVGREGRGYGDGAQPTLTALTDLGTILGTVAGPMDGGIPATGTDWGQAVATDTTPVWAAIDRHSALQVAVMAATSLGSGVQAAPSAPAEEDSVAAFMDLAEATSAAGDSLAMEILALRRNGCH
jgi:hypothetical protein